MVWILALMACKKSVTPPSQSSVLAERLPASEPVTLVGSGPWAASGLSLYVPPDWSGQEGPPPQVLGLTQEGPGTRFDVFVNAERDLSGCDFRSEALFRAVPAIGLSSSATCVVDGAIRQVWWASVEGRMVHIEVTYPAGQAVRARLAVGPLLEGLKLEQ